MKLQFKILAFVVVLSPFLFLFVYKHQSQPKNHPHDRVHIVLDYLHYDSASVWGQIVKHKQSNKLVANKNKSHYEYEFVLKSKRYRGLVYETELHRDNHQHLGVSDSIRILYSQSDPFLNIPHIIADDLHRANQ